MADFSPQIFGMVGPQFLAMQPEDVSPPVDQNAPGPVTPYQDFLNKQAALARIQSENVPVEKPFDFVGNLPPSPPPVAYPTPYNTGPGLNNILRAVPWAYLFGGVRGASALTSGAAQGLNAYAQGEDQKALAEAQYNERMQEFNYANQVRAQQFAAEQNRQNNQARGDFNTVQVNLHKSRQEGAENELQRSGAELRNQRTSLTKQIADTLHAVVTGSLPLKLALNEYHKVEAMQANLRDRLGGGDLPSSLVGIGEDQMADLYNKMKALDESKLTDLEKERIWSDTLKGINQNTQFNYNKRLGMQLDFDREKLRQQHAIQVSDAAARIFATEMEGWRTQVNANLSYQKNEADVLAYNLKQKRDSQVEQYKTAIDEYNNATKRLAANRKEADELAKLQATGGPRFTYTDDQKQRMADLAQEAQDLAVDIDSATRKVRVARTQLIIPPSIKKTAPASPFPGVGAPPAPPGTYRSSKGSSDAGGSEVSSHGRPAPPKKPTSTKHEQLQKFLRG